MKPVTLTIPQMPGANTRLTRRNAWPHLMVLPLFLLVAPSVRAQSFSINWSRIAGGGSTSTGGTLAVSGTIGQPDASGPLTNAQHTIRGGFWTHPVAVQVMDAPTLTIGAAAPGQATLSWSPATPGFILQEAVSLTPPNWTNAASGAANPVTIPAGSSMKFYRLSKP